MPFDAAEITDLFKFRLKESDEWRYVPEPTDPEMHKFRDAVLAAQRGITGLSEADTEGEDGSKEFTKRLDALTYEQRTRLSEEVTEHVIEFCKGTPSAAEIGAMPALTRLGFVGWLLGVLSPLF